MAERALAAGFTAAEDESEEDTTTTGSSAGPPLSGTRAERHQVMLHGQIAEALG
jgi:hypothetical protein